MPYNPGISDVSGLLLGRGIERGAASITDLIEQSSAANRKAKAYRVMAIDGLGMDPKEVGRMSLPKLEGTLQAVAIKEVQAQMKARKQERQDKEIERLALQQFNQRLAAGQPVGGQGPGQAMTPELMMQAAAETGQLTPALGAQMARMVQESQGSERFTPEMQEFDGRKFLVNPRTGGVETELTQKDPVQAPPGMQATGAAMDKDGNLSFTFKPEGEGKALTQGEVSQVAALTQAEQDITALEAIFKKLGADFGGPVSGRWKSYVGLGQNPKLASIQNAITAATPNLARGVFREVGVLTDEDIRRYKALLPGPYDTGAVREVKLTQLRERIQQGKRELMSSLKSAGRQVEGFEGAAATEPPKRFNTEAEARAAGLKPGKAGDVFELYDPATATWRPARLQ